VKLRPFPPWCTPLCGKIIPDAKGLTKEQAMTSPILAIDHLKISVADLEFEVANYAALFDTAPSWHGHLDGRDMAMFTMENVGLQLVESEQASGLDAVCFAVDKLPRMHRRLDRVGISSSEGMLEESGTLTRSRKLRVSPVEDTRGIQLSFVEHSSRDSAKMTQSRSGLDHIVVASQNAQGTAFLLGSQLNLDMRMDMSRPEWNARLMFFRCGDAIVEVFEHLSDDAPQAPAASCLDDQAKSDSFYGLTWRVEDADASHKRLTDAGFDVSGVRTGRKPGSRVLTVRNKTANVATLLIELPKT